MWTELICALQSSPTKLTCVSQGREHTKMTGQGHSLSPGCASSGESGILKSSYSAKSLCSSHAARVLLRAMLHAQSHGLII